MLRNVVVDTGPMVALFDTNDPYHERASAFVRTTPAALISTLACVTEAMFLLDFSQRAQVGLLEWIHRGGLRLENLDAEDLARISELLVKYGDLPMDFADGTLVVVCDRLSIPYIATVDSDFDVYRFDSRKPFVNVLR